MEPYELLPQASRLCPVASWGGRDNPPEAGVAADIQSPAGAA